MKCRDCRSPIASTSTRCRRCHQLRISFRHGGKGSPEYVAWFNMRQRCERKTHEAYKNYGGRGIRVHPRWASFANFLADMGRKPAPDLELDRIKNDEDYKPGNCRWATRSVNAANRRPRARNKLGQYA